MTLTRSSLAVVMATALKVLLVTSVIGGRPVQAQQTPSVENEVVFAFYSCRLASITKELDLTLSFGGTGQITPPPNRGLEIIRREAGDVGHCESLAAAVKNKAVSLGCIASQIASPPLGGVSENIVFSLLCQDTRTALINTIGALGKEALVTTP